MAVNSANNDMSAAEIERVRLLAGAEKLKVQESAAQIKTIEIETNSLEIRKSSASNPSSSGSTPSFSGSGSPASAGKSSVEAGLYGDLAMDAMGLKTLSTAIEFFDTRRMDAAGGFKHVDGIMGPNVRTMDQMIRDTERAPGSYDAVSSVFKNRRGGGEDIIMSANLAASSLKDQGKEAISTWNCPEKAAKLSFVAQAKQLTFTREMESKQAYDSVAPAQQNLSGVKFQAMQMGLGMGSGPSIRAKDLLSETNKASEDSSGSWRSA